jgi:hypothetical protein
MAARAALLLPLFLLVFDDDPPAAGPPARAAWAWTTLLKVLSRATGNKANMRAAADSVTRGY